jgi:hypothetical protein
MKIIINTNSNENAAVRNVSRKFNEMCGHDAANDMLAEIKNYGIKADVMPTNDGTSTVIIIPDKVVNAIAKIIAKMMNFISILKPIMINFFEDISEEFDSLEDLRDDDHSNGSNPEVKE